MIVGGLCSNIALSYKEASRSNIWEEMDNLC